MRSLRDLGFIESKKGPSGDFHYVLLLNPNVAIEVLRRQGKVQDGLYGRFRERLIDIGAQSDIGLYEQHIADSDAPNAGSKSSKKPILRKGSQPKGPSKATRASRAVRAQSMSRPKSKER
jgi:hypothetical protein